MIEVESKVSLFMYWRTLTLCEGELVGEEEGDGIVA